MKIRKKKKKKFYHNILSFWKMKKILKFWIITMDFDLNLVVFFFKNPFKQVLEKLLLYHSKSLLEGYQMTCHQKIEKNIIDGHRP